MGLLRTFGVIRKDAVGISKRFKPFEIKNLGGSWIYSETDKHVMLRADGQRWKVLKPGMESSEEESDGDDGDEATRGPEVRGVGYGMGYGDAGPSYTEAGSSSHFDYASQSFDPNWAFQGEMSEVIRNTRPDPYYSQWPESAQALFDHQTYTGASCERRLKSIGDRQETWNQTHAFNFQQEVNFRYEDDRLQRTHDQWHAGEPVIPDPMIIDYTSLPPHDGSIDYPTPPVHHSPWVDPRQDYMQQQPPQASGEEGVFGFSSLLDTMRDVFGPPGPRYF